MSTKLCFEFPRRDSSALSRRRQREAELLGRAFPSGAWERGTSTSLCSRDRLMLKPYFETEGPFGVPMKDAQAKLLEERLKEAPREEAFAFRRLSLARGLAEWQPEGR